MSRGEVARTDGVFMYDAAAAKTTMMSVGESPRFIGRDLVQYDLRGSDPQTAFTDLWRGGEVARVPLVPASPPPTIRYEDGRLFVCEMRGYSEDRGEGLGRIRLLHDDDLDRHLDERLIPPVLALLGALASDRIHEVRVGDVVVGVARDACHGGLGCVDGRPPHVGGGEPHTPRRLPWQAARAATTAA